MADNPGMRALAALVVGAFLLAGCADAAAGDDAGLQPTWPARDTAACEAAGEEVTAGFTTMIDRAATDPDSFNAGATESGRILRGLIDTLGAACHDDALYAAAVSDAVVATSQHEPPAGLFASTARTEGVGTMCQVLESFVSARGQTFTPQAQLVCSGR